jgi:hypothetical protein
VSVSKSKSPSISPDLNELQVKLPVNAIYITGILT